MAAKGKTLKFFTAITLIVIVAFIAAPLAASCNILDRKPHYDFKPCKISKPHYGVSEKIPSIVLLEKHDFTRQTLGSNGCWLRQLHQTDQIVYSGLNIIAEYNAGSSATSPGNEYIYSGGIDSLAMVAFNNNSKRLVAHRNQQWSIVGLVDFDNQTLEEQYAYNVFGERTILDDVGTVRTSSSFNNRYGYTSREHDDETGMMYFRARMYDPTTGEFISKDPLEYVDGYSMYRGYFTLNGVDPTGRVSRVFKPKTPKSMPWASVGVNQGIVYDGVFRRPDDNGVDPGAYGDTNVIHLFADCGCQCVDKKKCTYKLRCVVVFYGQIRINEWYARDKGVDIKGVYAHEQRHIANFLSGANFAAAVLNHSEQLHQEASKEKCIAQRDFDEKRFKKFFEMLKESQRNHTTPHPKDGDINYKPIGTMPKNPTQIFLAFLRILVNGMIVGVTTQARFLKTSIRMKIGHLTISKNGSRRTKNGLGEASKASILNKIPCYIYIDFSCNYLACFANGHRTQE